MPERTRWPTVTAHDPICSYIRCFISPPLEKNTQWLILIKPPQASWFIRRIRTNTSAVRRYKFPISHAYTYIYTLLYFYSSNGLFTSEVENLHQKYITSIPQWKVHIESISSIELSDGVSCHSHIWIQCVGLIELCLLPRIQFHLLELHIHGLAHKNSSGALAIELRIFFYMLSLPWRWFHTYTSFPEFCTVLCFWPNLVNPIHIFHFLYFFGISGMIWVPSCKAYS